MRNHDESSYLINSLLVDEQHTTSTLEHLSEHEAKEAIDSMNKCYDHTLFESCQLMSKSRRTNGALTSNVFINDAVTSNEKTSDEDVEMSESSDKLATENDSNNNSNLFASNYITFDSASILNDQIQSDTHRTDCLAKADVKFALNSLKKCVLAQPAQQQSNEQQSRTEAQDVNRSEENKPKDDLADNEQNDNSSSVENEQVTSSEELAHEIESIQIKKSQEESRRIKKAQEESRRIKKNPEESRRIQKNPEESRIKKNKEE
jgi:hypothetical protein